ncbi:uncharacterized protein LOC135812181 [Sycon ciliatum]|uniref:uncharacterized protein LOC135812181 n=1 Tax=Sycon ciliatum TaxID=27933 RepID=UPI0031F6C1E3
MHAHCGKGGSKWQVRFSVCLHYAMVVLSALATRAADVKCNMRSGSTCICDLEDKSGSLDFSPLSKKDGTPFFKDYKSGSWTYSWNPCVPFTEGKCKTDVAVCQSGDYVGGRQTGVQCTVTGTNPIKGTLAYANGDVLGKTPRTGVINFQCDPTKEHDFTAHGESPRGHYIMTLNSKYACLHVPPPPQTNPPQTTPPKTQPPPPPGPTTASHHRQPEHNSISLGTIMDICVLMAVISYAAGGIAFMYFRRGARGKEALPNYQIWTGLPVLVKEGALFIVTKVKALKSGSRGSYDSL